MDCFAVFRWLRSARLASRSLRQMSALRIVICSSIAMILRCLRSLSSRLIVEVKDHGDNLKGLIKKYIIRGGKQQRMKITIELGEHTKAVANAVPQSAVALKQGFGLQPAGIAVRQIKKVLKCVSFPAFPAIRTVVRPRIAQISSCIHWPRFFAFNQVVAAEFPVKTL